MSKNPFGSFKQLKRQSPYLIWLVGEGGAGKTTLILEFLRRFNPGVIVPMDQRPGEYELLLNEEVPVYPVTADSDDWMDMGKILTALRAGVPGSDIESIIWDSATPGFREENVRATQNANLSYDERKAALGSGNKSAAFVDKSLWMENLGSVANLGRHVIWVSHEFEGRDQGGQEVTKTTITAHETRKFTHNINLKLRVLVDGDNRAVQVQWARNRPSMDGKIYPDIQGMWAGVWDRILGDFDTAEQVTFYDRKLFSNPDEAIALGEEAARAGGAPFANEFAAKDAYERLREKVKAMSPAERKGKNPAAVMASMWQAYVRERVDNAPPDGQRETSMNAEETKRAGVPDNPGPVPEPPEPPAGFDENYVGPEMEEPEEPPEPIF